jgi:hypothetical protein
MTYSQKQNKTLNNNSNRWAGAENNALGKGTFNLA